MAGHVDVRYTSERCYIQGQKLNIWGEERLYKILIVEDDETIAGGLKNHLGKWNYQAECMTDFKDVMGKFVDFEPQLVLLDIVLPFFNGFHWCQEIRKISKVPIIFLSSANDNMNIVMAKVQAVLRRTYEFRGTADIMEWNGAILNLADATVLYQDQKQELTKNEFKILQMLLENTGKIVSRESIMTRLWDSNEFIDDNTLTVNVARLRKKMEQIGLGGKIITKKGIGYMVEA